MVQVEAFESLFIVGAVQNEPVGLRVIDAIAEGRVQSPGNLVDEVIHIAFEAAIVVTAEDDTAFVVEEQPAGEMDGLHAQQIGVIEDVAGEETRAVQDQRAGKAPKRPRLEKASRGEGVLNAVVLLRGQRLDQRIAGRDIPWAICLFVRAEEIEPERQTDNDHRQEHKGSGYDRGEVQLFLEDVDGIRGWRRSSGPGQRWLTPHEFL